VEAARSGNLPLVQQLLSGGADVNARGANAQTALHEAASSCRPDIAQVLVKAGANAGYRDASRRTPGMIASNCRDRTALNELLRLLVTAPPKTGGESSAQHRFLLHEAVARGDMSLLNMYAKLGQDLNAPDAKGDFPLEIACRNGRVEVVRLLLGHGARVDRRTASGTTILHEAALGGNAEIVELLIERGASVDTPDTDAGSTPLQYASSFGRVPVVRVLLAHGADPRRKNRRGLDALEVAQRNGQDQVVSLLRKWTPK
jgi:ankyrin repeat protein